MPVRINNTGLFLLMPLVEEKIKEFPDNQEWRAIRKSLRQSMKNRGLEYDDSFTEPELPVWGRDYV